MKIINCVIADDEPIARKGIKEFIEKTGFLNYAGSAKDVNAVTALLKEKEVDLLFMDIEMPGTSGLDFLKNSRVNMPLVILITAYSNYAVESYNLSVLDYMLKPVSYERFLLGAEKAFAQIVKNPVNRTRKEYFFMRSEGRYEKIILADIVYISAMQNYVRIHYAGGKTLIVHSTLKMIFTALGEENFIAVHKSYIVNMDYINSFSRTHVSLSEFGQIPIGRHFRPDILPRLFVNS